MTNEAIQNCCRQAEDRLAAGRPAEAIAVLAPFRDHLDLKVRLVLGQALLCDDQTEACIGLLAEWGEQFLTNPYYQLLSLAAYAQAAAKTKRTQFQAHVDDLVLLASTSHYSQHEFEWYLRLMLDSSVVVPPEQILLQRYERDFDASARYFRNFRALRPAQFVSPVQAGNAVEAIQYEEKWITIPPAKYFAEPGAVAADYAAGKTGVQYIGSTPFVRVTDVTLYMYEGCFGFCTQLGGSRLIGDGPHGAVILGEHGPVTSHGRNLFSRLDFFDGRRHEKRILKGSYLLPFRVAGQYYYHHIMETIRISLEADQAGIKSNILLPDADSYFSRFSRTVYSQSLHLLAGHCASRFRYLPEGVYFVEELIIPARWDYLAACSNPMMTGDGEIAPKQDKFLFVSRQHASNRRVLNEQELFGIAKSAIPGLELVHLEELDFIQQMDLFRRAAFVCGVHGGGLTNLLFAQAGTRVIEIHPRSSTPAFSHISFSRNLDYLCYYPGQNEGHNSDFFIDPKIFAGCIDKFQ